MSSQPKKKDFFNRGKGVNPSDFEPDSEVYASPPTSPSNLTPQSPLSFDVGASVSPRPLEFPQTLSAPSSPPPVYPLPTHYGLYSPPYTTHSHYLAHPMCPPSMPGGYSLPGMPYTSLELSAAAAHGASGLPSTAFPETHLVRNYTPHTTYSPQEYWGVTSGDKEFKHREADKESSTNPAKETSNVPTRQQKCSLCFNHGIIKEKKGHKWQCTFKNCECQRCIITKGRQKTMREQQKLTRHLQKIQL